MHYIESGGGTPLVLLHAFPADARMWNPARTGLDDQARVIAPDQRGLGESPLNGSWSPSPGARDGDWAAEHPSIDTAAADVLALLDRLELPEVVLGGCSMGGYVAMAVLRAAPKRVAGLLLVDTKAVADNDEQRTNRLNAAERSEREGTSGWLAEGTLPNVLGRTTHEQRPEVLKHVRELIDAQPPEGVAWAQRAMASRPDSTEVLRAFSGPALVVVGAEDSLTPPEHARELADVLPGGELVTLPGAGHLPPVETPDAFAGVVRPWLAELG